MGAMKSLDLKDLKYIHDVETMETLDIRSVLLATGLFEASKNNKILHLEHAKKTKPQISVFDNDNACHCSDCSFHAKSPLDVATHFKKGDYAQGLKWLSETFGVKRIPNPAYKPPKTEEKNWKKRVANYVPSVPVIPIIEISKEEYVFTYDIFDSTKTRPANIDKGKEAYNTLSYANRLLLVYTDIYHYSLEQNQQQKTEYFKARKINTEHSGLNQLGFIPVEKFAELVGQLAEEYPVDDLVEFGVINDSKHNKPFSFALHYVLRGGLIVFPSFHRYQTNLVTGFMFRPSNPEEWMIKKGMKEIQMSKNDIVETLPHGFTNDFIVAENAIKCVVEGGPDAYCSPEEINGKRLIFIASPGTHGTKENQLGLLKGQTLRIMLDPDEPGRIGANGSITVNIDLIEKKIFPRDTQGMAAYEECIKTLHSKGIKFYENKQDGLVQKCLRAGVIPEVVSWDKNYGDMNDVKKHIENGVVPFKTMEEFLTKFTSIKRIKTT